MLKEERQFIILEELRIHNKVLTSELSQTLEVSEDTIRRDLRDLADGGKIRKVHGGAVVNAFPPYDFRDREIFALERKVLLAKKAVGLFKPGQVILMDGGTTNLELAKRIPSDLQVTIFTNSLPVAVILSEHPSAEVIFIGGRLLKNEKVTAGIEATESLEGIRADWGVIGARSIHQKEGITENNWDESRVKKALVKASQKVMALIIEEKLESIHPYKVLEIKKLHTMVVDLPHDHKFLNPYLRLGIQIL
ncbi:MAG: DeoR/GlpR family DNA-binding transcription regulator [Bacteroidota bacterium]